MVVSTLKQSGGWYNYGINFYELSMDHQPQILKTEMNSLQRSDYGNSLSLNHKFDDFYCNHNETMTQKSNDNNNSINNIQNIKNPIISKIDECLELIENDSQSSKNCMHYAKNNRQIAWNERMFTTQQVLFFLFCFCVFFLCFNFTYGLCHAYPIFVLFLALVCLYYFFFCVFILGIVYSTNHIESEIQRPIFFQNKKQTNATKNKSIKNY